LATLLGQPQSRLLRLYHIQRTSRSQPPNLILAHRVLRLNLHDLSRALLLHPQLDHASQIARDEIGDADGGDRVASGDEGVIGLVGEPEGEDALLLEVGLVDSGKGAGDDEGAAVEAGLEGGVFSGGAFAVVLIESERNVVVQELVSVEDSCRRVGCCKGGIERGRKAGRTSSTTSIQG
jgi:hypothetical protein